MGFTFLSCEWLCAASADPLGSFWAVNGFYVASIDTLSSFWASWSSLVPEESSTSKK